LRGWCRWVGERVRPVNAEDRGAIGREKEAAEGRCEAGIRER
jgi:hypothetical protein